MGPVWRGGDNNEDQLLESCYRNSLQLAIEHCLYTIAFPSISTGVYRFPIERASRIAANAVKAFLEEHEGIEKVLFVRFGGRDYRVYQDVVQEVF